MTGSTFVFNGAQPLSRWQMLEQYAAFRRLYPGMRVRPGQTYYMPPAWSREQATATTRRHRRRSAG